MALHLRGEVRERVHGVARASAPTCVPRYEELYARGAYAPAEERERLARLVRRGGSAGRVLAQRPTATERSGE